MGVITGRIFSESELRAIAQALGDTESGLTNAEIDELLRHCQVADDHGPGTKWKRLYANLWNQQVRDGHRKASLGFIRKAMKPERYLRTPERFAAIRANLNMALSFAGLAIDEAGVLHSAGRVHTLRHAACTPTCLPSAAPNCSPTTIFMPCSKRQRAFSTSCARSPD